jgi:hypothetical protein
LYKQKGAPSEVQQKGAATVSKGKGPQGLSAHPGPLETPPAHDQVTSSADLPTFSQQFLLLLFSKICLSLFSQVYLLKRNEVSFL